LRAHRADPAAWNGDVKGDALPAHVDYIRNFDIAFRPERWLAGDAACGLKRYTLYGRSVCGQRRQ
jgi:hypothetical protein